MTAKPLILLLMLAGGCASSPTPNGTPPGPSGFHINGTLEINLTPQMTEKTGLPGTLKGTIDVDVSSTTVANCPSRSRNEGHMSFVITDGSGKQTLAKANLNVTGESDGSPSQGAGETIGRFVGTMLLITRSMPEASATPRSSSLSQPENH